MKYKKHGRNKERLITKMSAKTFEVNRKKFTSNFLTNRIKSDTIKLIVYLNRLHLFIGKKVAQKGKRFELFLRKHFKFLFGNHEKSNQTKRYNRLSKNCVF